MAAKRLYYDRAKFDPLWRKLADARRAGHLTTREMFGQGRIYHAASVSRPENERG